MLRGLSLLSIAGWQGSLTPAFAFRDPKLLFSLSSF
ncbi:hypothetical protein CYA_1121 [Synechococcus sp. JA-3-3Ab]|nr:hypothetical protein CYA_1121 [Synechococcus sp. JA-3-3Ab]